MRNLRANDIIVAGFFLQQCIEKYLKAFLIKHGWKLRKVHRLDALLDEAININPELDIFHGFCERTSSYYIADRYPPFGSLEITKEDIKEDLVSAKKLVKHIFPGEKLSSVG